MHKTKVLKELSKKDQRWREIALKISGGDQSIADDLVQEMYLRRYVNDRGQQWNDFYIASTMRSLYLNMRRDERLLPVEEVPVDGIVDEKFEPDDQEQQILDKANQLPFKERELLELNYDLSLRDIQKKFGINYIYVYKTTKEAREKILGDKIHLYKNKRLKHRKMTTKSRGLGDTIEKITKATGIKNMVELLGKGKDCGCDKRQEVLNRIFQYKHKPNCLTPEQIKEYKDFVDSREIKLLGKGKAEGVLSKEEALFVANFYSVVFNERKWEPKCFSCSGTALTLIGMIYKLDVVWLNNLAEKTKKKISS